MGENHRQTKAKEKQETMGTVAHTCSQTYQRGRKQPVWAKKLVRHISTNKSWIWGVGGHACHRSYTENINRKIVVQAGLGINARPI
jgi:hypothetical protein